MSVWLSQSVYACLTHKPSGGCVSVQLNIYTLRDRVETFEWNEGL